ncbi:hypothetical protein L5515_017365 [Caenorhabditis briggsae]|uniref:Uncharacterized protein n=1 Tax=Caenorhabditis briggsae TaxID=6238 RepID=A0AAE9JRF8_CAEBR|nr:hypothetical protein L5515_017365 [Caenorhabditis briggsae]
MVYVAVVQPFMTKVVEKQKTIEELEEKNQELMLQNPLNFWKRVEETGILQKPTDSHHHRPTVHFIIFKPGRKPKGK